MKQEILLEEIRDADIDSIKELYGVDEFYLYKVTLNKEYILLLMKLNEIDNLILDNAKQFDKLTSSLSVLLEKYLDNDFKRWNVYIFYLVQNKLNKQQKYKIENDTFFARKIVEDNYTSNLSDENIKKLISNHISFDDLNIKNTIPKRKDYISSSIIYEELFNVDTLESNKVIDILKSLEGNAKNEI
ncbi:MAG TPA: hypothetical protein ENK66_09495 [Arcobacter sp.]|nr:hypothetical protein [Arcobacter sp.]